VNETTLYLGPQFELIQNHTTGELQSKFLMTDYLSVTRKQNQVVKYHFTQKDRLGSTSQILDGSGERVTTKGYDAFGKPREGDTWAPMSAPALNFESEDSVSTAQIDITKRGFTDHEHLDNFELIHMNGRMYDFNNGRFLSVDPFIQGTTSQAINPYSYIQNNPLSGIDPSGYQKECKENCRDESEIKEGPKSQKDRDHRKGIGSGWQVAWSNGGSSQSTASQQKSFDTSDTNSNITKEVTNSRSDLTKKQLLKEYEEVSKQEGASEVSKSLEIEDGLVLNYKVSGTEKVVNNVERLMSKINNNSEGKKMLIGLARSGHQVRIYEHLGEGGSHHVVDGGVSTIALDTRIIKLDGVHLNVKGESANNARFFARYSLAHELYHAWQKSSSPPTPIGGRNVPWGNRYINGGVNPYEVSAVRFVNQMRYVDNKNYIRAYYRPDKAYLIDKYENVSGRMK
ncbi:MAG: RHS repeat-associated core domain-containing protein, partial [Marinicella sp.]